MTLGESPWHDYSSTRVLGPVGPLSLLTLTLAQPQHLGWFRSERCRSSNADALPGSPWHALCCPSVLGAVGYLTLSILTLSLTLTKTLALPQTQNYGWCRSESYRSSNTGTLLGSFWHAIPAPPRVNLCCRHWVPWKCHSFVCKKCALKKKKNC